MDETPYLLDSSRWLRLISEATHRPRPALFLDRDGTLIEERNYLADPDGVVLIEGACSVLRRARAAEMHIVIVTNQSGIGRGLFSWQDYYSVENRLLILLHENGASVDALLACGAAPTDNTSGSDWRKPNPGMLIAAGKALHIDLARSVVIGDKASDLAAGRAAGLRQAVHVATGHGACERVAAVRLATANFEVATVASLSDAIIVPLLA